MVRKLAERKFSKSLFFTHDGRNQERSWSCPKCFELPKCGRSRRSQKQKEANKRKGAQTSTKERKQGCQRPQKSTSAKILLTTRFETTRNSQNSQGLFKLSSWKGRKTEFHKNKPPPFAQRFSGEPTRKCSHAPPPSKDATHTNLGEIYFLGSLHESHAIDHGRQGDCVMEASVAMQRGSAIT